ncbi:MAG: hypothetical protein IKN39_00545 [Clostridia bacterium]|nr:hypothetical protein [Clostridia bacterium]
MSTVKAFIMAFCSGCILLGALCILLPKNNISKAAKYAISLAYLCIILSVSVGLKSVDLPKSAVTQKDFSNEQFSAATAKMIFAEALQAANINFSKIAVFTDKLQSGGISITKVYVYTASPIEKVSAVIGSKDYELVVVNE